MSDEWKSCFNSSLITHHSSLSCPGHVGLADVEVGGDLLHVVVVFERLHQFEHLLGLRAFETLELLRDHLDLGDLRLDAGVLDRGEYRVEVVGRGDDLEVVLVVPKVFRARVDRKSTRLNSSHLVISYAVFCLKKKKKIALALRHISVFFTIKTRYSETDNHHHRQTEMLHQETPSNQQHLVLSNVDHTLYYDSS